MRAAATALALSAALAFCAPAWGQSDPSPPAPASTQPAPEPAPPPPPKPVNETTLKSSISRAVRYLYSQQDAQGAIANRHSAEYVGGGEALAALALLWAGESPDEPRLKKTLDYLKALRPGHTYTRALRTIVFALLAEEADYRKVLDQDVGWLLMKDTGQLPSGGWGYGPASAMTRLRPDWTDASNSQFALLALRDAGDAGSRVPAEAWRVAEAYWRKLQNEDGGWGYQPETAGQRAQRPESHGSMTAAGIATYFLLADKLQAQQDLAEPVRPGPRVRRPPAAPTFSDRIDRGLAWLTQNYAVDQIPKYVWMMQPGQLCYYLYVLQRVGDTAGLRTIGKNDYAAQTAALLINQQQGNGSWGDSGIDTSFALLALLKADAPIAVTRLQLGKEAGKDPRDAAAIARWLSRAFRRPVTWQQVPADAPDAMFDSPLLYVNFSGPSNLPEGFADKFKRYIRNGGTCLAQSPPEDPAFPRTFQDYCLKLFPDYQRQEIRPDHPVFGVGFPIEVERRPRLLGVGDGCRTRIFILPEDLAAVWHQGLFQWQPTAFQLAGNIVLYAGGGSLPTGRLSAPPPPPPPPPARKFLQIARVKYAGDYYTCPQAVARLSDTLAHSLSIGLKEAAPVDPGARIDPAIDLLYLTGNAPPTFSPTQLKNLKAYLQGGGTLLIDPATGRGDFRASSEGVLAAISAPDAVRAVPPDSPLITGRFGGGMGADLTKARLLRSPTSQPVRPAPPTLSAVQIRGRMVAILSHYGLACSIEGTPCVENLGYTTADARKIALNVILYAAASR